jgi:CDP-glucose 4,6-dehydratase
MDRECLAIVTRDLAPDFVFHLAAQPIVRLSYRKPVETFAINVMGAVHMLDALRRSAKPCTVVMVTTDKCYQNREWLHPYREEDPMGGHDPYSASKGAAEIAIAAWRSSFSQALHAPVRIASARAGNVIGGGDWAPDRIVPDAIRAVLAGVPISVRNPHATRPWQHVLEPLSGYLQLAAKIYAKSQALPVAGTSPLVDLCSGFNFGPTVHSNQPVGTLVSTLLSHTGGSWQSICDPVAPHEASKLHLATEKAFHLIGWKPVWSFQDTVRMTASWYTQVSAGAYPQDLTRSQIADFENALKISYLT